MDAALETFIHNLRSYLKDVCPELAPALMLAVLGEAAISFEAVWKDYERSIAMSNLSREDVDLRIRLQMSQRKANNLWHLESLALKPDTIAQLTGPDPDKATSFYGHRLAWQQVAAKEWKEKQERLQRLRSYALAYEIVDSGTPLGDMRDIIYRSSNALPAVSGDEGGNTAGAAGTAAADDDGDGPTLKPRAPELQALKPQPMDTWRQRRSNIDSLQKLQKLADSFDDPGMKPPG